MLRSSTTVWALNDVAGQQKLRPRDPSALLPLSPQPKMLLKNLTRTFNRTENKDIKVPLLSGTNWDNLVLQNLHLP